ncbi:MAG: GHKL domain-containing protein [Deltaproteobacteria bacterium]|nr:GHKL domain-containing protein [Deltaproteobacteria bacterium]
MIETKYAPAERVDADVLRQQQEVFLEETSLLSLMNAVPNIVLILNEERQIVYANKPLTNFLDLNSWEEAVGKRPGELFECIHSDEMPGGCGTTEFCKVCGVVNGIIDSMEGSEIIRECRIFTKHKDARDLRVWATPFLKDEQSFTIISIMDISDEKRRQALERIFFHDVLNTASGIYGLTDILMEEKDPDESLEVTRILKGASERLLEEIQAQRQLTAAERGNLAVSLSEISTLSSINEAIGMIAGHEAVGGRTMSVDAAAEDVNVMTDPVLLRRVLVNMIKNALEAIPLGGDVSISCRKGHDCVVFSVHNHTIMSRDVQLQLFQRSFSTKGSGRGIGTYSMKLLGEKYLKGSVWFKSAKGAGTTMFLELPCA